MKERLGRLALRWNGRKGEGKEINRDIDRINEQIHP